MASKKEVTKEMQQVNELFTSDEVSLRAKGLFANLTKLSGEDRLDLILEKWACAKELVQFGALTIDITNPEDDKDED